MCFENMSGLKINYHKSKVVVLGHPTDIQESVANKLNCRIGSLPLTYLGLPISDKHLTAEQWMFLIQRLADRVEPWLGRFLSSGVRLILSNSCLASLPMYAMGLFLLVEGVHKQFDSIRAKFFWEGAGPHRKYHMVNWPDVCRPKECGGLGILNSKLMNEALMIKWIWKIYQLDTIWASIIKAKYSANGDIFTNTDRGGSQFWKSLHKVKHLFKAGEKHKVRNGVRTRFWLDWWHGDGPLCHRFPYLFSICDNQAISVATVVAAGCRFRRTLSTGGMAQWQRLNSLITSTALFNTQDEISWSLETSGRYSVSSMYNFVSQGATRPHFRVLWEAKLR